jgi:putative FmdB family regulatory protein
MPTYEYVCSACAHEWEEIQKISEPALEVCPSCGKSTAKRQISAGNFILKGGGWYADLYSSTPKGGSKGESSSSSSSPSPSSPPAKTETKSETKSDSKAPSTAPPTSTPSK